MRKPAHDSPSVRKKEESYSESVCWDREHWQQLLGLRIEENVERIRISKRTASKTITALYNAQRNVLTFIMRRHISHT